MASPRQLAYKDRFVWLLEQVVSSQWDDCDDFVDRFVFPDMTTPVPLVLYLSQTEWTTLYSAVLTGADLSYPNTAHDAEYLFLQSVICAMNQFCNAMINCLENDPDVLAALIDILSGAGYTGGVGDPEAPLSSEFTGANLLPAGYVCTDDRAFGMALAVVEAIHDANLEVLQAIEILTNPIEIAAELGDNIPGIGMMASAGDVASWIQDSATEAYELAWSDVVRDELACILWCSFKGECSLTYDSIWDVYLSSAGASPPAGNNLETWLAWLILLPFTASLSTVATVSLLGLLAMRYGGSFGMFQLGIRSMETVINLAQNDSSNNWSVVCDPCVLSWCVNLAETDANVVITMVRTGMYYDAGGWHGNNPAENDLAGLDFNFVDTSYTQTRIEIDFITNGDRQYNFPDGPELQLTGTYTGDFEYPAGLQTHTINSSIVGNFRVYAGDYATIVAVRIYGSGSRPFSSPAC